jgi:DNA-binding SARP family transcriptional activator/DNA-binding beta-propeller fold protein YncE
VLGPVEVKIGDRLVDLGGAKQRALLAVLVLHASHPVSSSRLIAELWEQPPATALKSVQVYVSRLRRTLEGTTARIQTTPAGYLLTADAQDVDVLRFEALAAEGRAALGREPAAASALFGEALALWRGEPLADLAAEPFTRQAIPRLEERRLAVQEDQVEADLALGRHTEVVGDLGALLSDHPYRERLHAQLMLALYRSGRQAEALEVYQRARATLHDELGIEPGPELQRLHTAILRQDPALQHSGPANLSSHESGAGVQAEPGGPGEAQSPPSVPAPPPSRRSSPSSGRRLRRLGLIAVPGVALAAAAGLLLILARPGAARVVLRANSVAVVDAATGSPVADIPAGAHPGPIAITGGAAWVGNTGDRTLQRIDLQARTVTRTFGLSQTPASLTAGPGVVWIGNGFGGTLSRVLTSYNQLSAPFFPGQPIKGLLAVATSPAALWVGLGDDTLLRLDPASMRTRATITVPGRAEEIAVAGHTVWTLQFFDNSVDRIDSRTGHITPTALPGRPVAIAVGDGAIWVATAGDDQLWRITPATGAISRSFPLGVTPSAIAVQPGAVWVASGTDGVLERINPATGTILPFNLHRPIGGLAIAGPDLWLTLD